MEHLNRSLKDIIRHMGSNVQPSTLVRAAKAIGVVHDVCTIFEKEVKGLKNSGRHSKPSLTKDYKRIFGQLMESKVYDIVPNLSHSSISLNCCPLNNYKKEDINILVTRKCGSRSFVCSAVD